MSMSHARGFTVLEVLIVIALMASVALMAAPLVGNRAISDTLDSAVARTANMLYEAQTSAMSGRNNARYGIHFTTTSATMFEGAAYNVADPNNVVYVFPGAVTASGVAITGGGADIIFASRKGIPVQTGSITFTDAGGDSGSLVINAAGMIDVN